MRALAVRTRFLSSEADGPRLPASFERVLPRAYRRRYEPSWAQTAPARARLSSERRAAMADDTSLVLYDPRTADPEVMALAGFLAG